jgi:hypothetical protein
MHGGEKKHLSRIALIVPVHEVEPESNRNAHCDPWRASPTEHARVYPGISDATRSGAALKYRRLAVPSVLYYPA